jgi:hypothetical protein
MYAMQVPATISSISVAVERFEAAVYRADAVFQAEVLPRAAHGAILVAHCIVQLAIATVLLGMHLRAWYDDYNAASVPPMEEAPMLALPAGPVPLLLLPAPKLVTVTTGKPTPKLVTVTTGKPAPKRRGQAGIASQKKATTAKNARGKAVSID